MGPEAIMFVLLGVVWGLAILSLLYGICLGSDAAYVNAGILAITAVFLTVILFQYYHPPTYHIYIKDTP